MMNLAARILCSSIGLVPLAAASADVVNLNPVADAFVSSAQPAGNFGAAGALSVAAPGLSLGEFQTLVRFDTGPAIAAFNASYGASNWAITDITLTFTSTAPNNPIFNAADAGGVSAYWMQNDSWVEGSGGPSSPSATGISFSTLPGFLSPGDEFVSSAVYNGSTSGTIAFQPAFTPGFVTDVSLGSLVSFRLAASTATTSWVFNSRTFGTVSSRPVLSITAVPAPGTALVLAAAGLLSGRRRR